MSYNWFNLDNQMDYTRKIIRWFELLEHGYDVDCIQSTCNIHAPH